MSNEQLKVKGIVVTANGGADVLKMGEFDLGQPAAGQALIRIKAAGVNYIDVYHRFGRYPLPLPFTPGMEASGVVEALGPVDGSKAGSSNNDINVGDRVAYSGKSRCLRAICSGQYRRLDPAHRSNQF